MAPLDSCSLTIFLFKFLGLLTLTVLLQRLVKLFGLDIDRSSPSLGARALREVGTHAAIRVTDAGAEDTDSEAALIGMADSTACPTDHMTLRLIIHPGALRPHSRLAGSGCVGVGRLRR